MAQRELLVCDFCKIEILQGQCAGWIHTEPIGIDIRTATEESTERDFCCDECLINWFQLRGKA